MLRGYGPIQVTIDGITTAEFQGNEFVKIPVQSGKHKLSTIHLLNISNAVRESFEANMTYYFNATFEPRTTTGILPEVTKEEALSKIQKMKEIK
jgi:hypothetical protein